VSNQITENVSHQEITDCAVAHVALTAFADVTLLIDRSGTIVSCFFGHESTLEHELPHLIGTSWLQTIARDSLKKAELLLDDAPSLHLGRGREVNHVAARSQPQIPIRYSSIQQAAGGVLLVGRDLRAATYLQSQLIRSQQSVEASGQRVSAAESRFKALFQTSPDALLIADESTHRILEANASALTAFDLAPGHIINRTLESLFHDRDSSALADLLIRAKSGLDSGSAPLHSALGRVKFNATATVFRQEDGAAVLVRLASENRDSDHSHAATPHLDNLIDLLPEAFVITDGDGQVLMANRGFLDLAELPAGAAAIGQPLERWLGRQGMDFGMMFGVLHEAGRLREVASMVRGLYGSVTPVDVSGIRLQDGAETRMGFVLHRQSNAIMPTESAPVLARSADQTRQLVGSVPLKDIVREAADLIERLCVEAALEMSGDNRAAAADMLGLSRQSLYAKLHRYGLGDLGSNESDLSNTT
jgi:transcriptional regulator PpsR